jgi:hypothetical protein
MYSDSKSSRLRPHDAARSSRDPSVARSDPRRGRPIPPEPEAGGEVVQTHRNHRSADGSQSPHSTVLSEVEEDIIVEFRRRTLRPSWRAYRKAETTRPFSATPPPQSGRHRASSILLVKRCAGPLCARSDGAEFVARYRLASPRARILVLAQSLEIRL